MYAYSACISYVDTLRKERGHVPRGAFTSWITFYMEPNGERRSDTLSENPLRKIKALRSSATRCRRPLCSERSKYEAEGRHGVIRLA